MLLIDFKNSYLHVFHKGRDKQIVQEVRADEDIRLLTKIIDLILESRTNEYFDNLVEDAKILISELTKVKQDHP